VCVCERDLNSIRCNVKQVVIVTAVLISCVKSERERNNIVVKGTQVSGKAAAVLTPKDATLKYFVSRAASFRVQQQAGVLGCRGV
jgi:hypothetical protein